MYTLSLKGTIHTIQVDFAHLLGKACVIHIQGASVWQGHFNTQLQTVILPDRQPYLVISLGHGHQYSINLTWTTDFQLLIGQSAIVWIGLETERQRASYLKIMMWVGKCSGKGSSRHANKMPLYCWWAIKKHNLMKGSFHWWLKLGYEDIF